MRLFVVRDRRNGDGVPDVGFVPVVEMLGSVLHQHHLPQFIDLALIVVEIGMVSVGDRRDAPPVSLGRIGRPRFLADGNPHGPIRAGDHRNRQEPESRSPHFAPPRENSIQTACVNESSRIAQSRCRQVLILALFYRIVRVGGRSAHYGNLSPARGALGELPARKAPHDQILPLEVIAAPQEFDACRCGCRAADADQIDGETKAVRDDPAAQPRGHTARGRERPECGCRP